jgi:uncharacterized damage-inducible protein DinB
MIETLIREYADYDRWANARFVQRLQGEPPAVLDAPLRSSFPDLRSTLLHIRDAACAWTARLKGDAVRWPAEESREPDTVLVHAERFRAAVHALDAEGLRQVIAYRDLKGREHRAEAWRMVMHCVNHGTQHRGQLITMMRMLGLEGIPANDLVVFQRERAG